MTDTEVEDRITVFLRLGRRPKHTALQELRSEALDVVDRTTPYQLIPMSKYMVAEIKTMTGESLIVLITTLNRSISSAMRAEDRENIVYAPSELSEHFTISSEADLVTMMSKHFVSK